MSVLLLARAPGMPADAFGRARSPAGRALVEAAAGYVPGLRGLRAARDERGWHWPGTSWRATVSHTGPAGAALLAEGVHIGVDLQRECRRPAALRWLGRVLAAGAGPDEEVPAPDLRTWAEVEALLKARGTAGRRPDSVPPPPAWRPGWRRCHDGLWLLSTPTGPVAPAAHLAVAAARPLAFRVRVLHHLSSRRSVRP
ncbi:hypothetical protein I5Q34_23495 [Streptomyces sp. AV19]|uniref:hypothetical protein n=1 Tax=Streptomyces sp. AV19 TaxID=2793068 RepID=UPI0018FE7712|nr:hypothetical protein [Streptomyces sp. AV19]MBH1937195.1 hypothetical protein [Streptomyces sp. AV19]MDG4533468.1 hypothetical protein [Streptomyces sp. AV19]